jgi:hypothetical protein
MASQNHHAHQDTSLKVLAAISLAFLLVALGQYLSLAGIESKQLGYIKLAKFSASLTIYAVTMFGLLKQITCGRQLLAWAATAACLGGVLELSTLLIQALVPSWQTALVAVTRLAILPPTFLMIVAFRLLLKENIDLALRHALLWATGLAIFGCLPGALMLTEINQPQSSYGSLKLAHFIGLHTLQLMPLAYFLVSKQTTNSEKQIKVIDSIGLLLLMLIALLTIRSTTETTILLALGAALLATNMDSKAGHTNTTPGANIPFSRSKF